MKIYKKYQKLMPSGTELILQGQSDTGQRIRVAIAKTVDSNIDAQAWHKAKKESIRMALVTLEMVCNRK